MAFPPLQCGDDRLCRVRCHSGAHTVTDDIRKAVFVQVRAATGRFQVGRGQLERITMNTVTLGIASFEDFGRRFVANMKGKAQGQFADSQRLL